MSLPNELAKAIETELTTIDFSLFSKAIEELSLRYRNSEKVLISSTIHRLAYIGVRLPATYAVIKAVLTQLKKALPNIELASLLDLGAGPGTVAWAALNLFPAINKITLIEDDKNMLALGKKLSNNNVSLKSAEWLNLNLIKEHQFSANDLITISYVLGELPLVERKVLVQKAWQATSKILLLIEPGTPKGFSNILEAREQLISLGANIVAPCPHQEICPMQENDWCHFSERLPRSSLHRRAKAGYLSYEDEKFSYLIVSKDVVNRPFARIIRHPLKRKGHLQLSLCTSNGLKNLTISASKDNYKLAKKSDWGDSLDLRQEE
ncbi:MAG: rRNA methyltransferase [Blastocatellia bacterium]|nr:rRNA methyltransferase [Blastocatellia bacterium]MBN8721554.1 rRNA methyltransferase [Acidobacteriota bacterium]